MTPVTSARALNVFFAVVLAYIAGANHDTIKAQLAEAGGALRSAAVVLVEFAASRHVK